MNFSALAQAVACGLRTPEQIEASAKELGFSLDRAVFDKQVAQFKETNKLNSWDAEVFAVGTWNGYAFTEKDIDAIVESFAALNSDGYLEVPLKFGHNDDQPMTDGQPALGWVSKLFKQKDDKGRVKLMATFDAVPETVFSAVKAGRYRKVSIELEFDVKHKGTMYPYVMTGVALLGADLPAVNTLADLTAYMGRGFLTASRKACFSAVSGKLTKEEKKMAEIDDKELADLRAKLAEAQAQTAQFKKDQETREANEKAAKVATARAKFTALLDGAVKDMRITPAQRAAYAKALRVDDDSAVMALTDADVEVMLPAKADDKGGAFSRKAGEDDKGDTDAQLHQRATEIINNSGGKLRYSRALEMAMQEKPELAKAHLGIA